MVTVMLIWHWFLTMLMCATILPEPYMVGILSFAVVFCFWSINYIGVELEMPFGDDDNDLPLHGMMRDMNESLCELLLDGALHVPKFEFEPHEHSLLVTAEPPCIEHYLLHLCDKKKAAKGLVKDKENLDNGYGRVLSKGKISANM